MIVSRRWLPLLLLGFVLFNGCAGFSDDTPGGNARQDTTEAVRLKAILLEAPDLAGSAIDVSLSDEQIVLEGFVEKASQRQRAESLVRENSDIDRVTNRIKVK